MHSVLKVKENLSYSFLLGFIYQGAAYIPGTTQFYIVNKYIEIHKQSHLSGLRLYFSRTLAYAVRHLNV